MKYHLLLPPVLLALCGCHSDLHYQEQAVESARKFIYKHARELTPEQFAYVRFTPPVLLTGPVLARNEKNAVDDSLAGGEKMQICIAWRIPEQETDYLVFGISEPRMAYWSPLKLIRRRIGKFDSMAFSAMNQSRAYVMNSLHGQLSAADLNRVRFSHPEVVLTRFPLEEPADSTGKEGDSAKKEETTGENRTPVPWKKVQRDKAAEEGLVQISLLWKISGERYVVCCGKGNKDLDKWKILMGGIIDAAEVREATVEKIKSSDRFLVPDKKSAAPEAPPAPEAAPKNSEPQKSVEGGK